MLLHICPCRVADGAGRCSEQYVVLQSWMPQGVSPASRRTETTLVDGDFDDNALDLGRAAPSDAVLD